MRLIKLLFILHAIFSSILLIGQNHNTKRYRIELKQYSLLEGKSNVYIVKNRKIKRHIQYTDYFRLSKLPPKYLSKQEMDSIKFFTNYLIENLSNGNAYADYSVLDGWIWTLQINIGKDEYKYSFENCSCLYLNNLINFINDKLKKKGTYFSN